MLLLPLDPKIFALFIIEFAEMAFITPVVSLGFER